MEFNGFILLAILWFVINLITSSRRKPAPPTLPPREQPQREPDVWQQLPQRRTANAGADPTQNEGSRLEQMLRDLQRTLEESTQSPYSTPLPLPLPPAEVEGRSLETEPEIVSLEDEVRREARVRVDRDDEAGEFETRRIQAAAARDHTRTRVDRPALEEKIRQEPAEHTATRGYTAQQLRDAIVWREILGPPVSERHNG